MKSGIKPTGAPFPGFAAFFRFEQPPSIRVYGGEIDNQGWRAPRAKPSLAYHPMDDHQALFKGRASADRPLLVRHARGLARPSDVIWSTAPVVGPRVLAVLQKGAFTGWGTWPVEVRDRDGTLVPGYAGLAVTGRCGPWDFSSCEEVDVEFPYGRMRRVRGFRFDPAGWDGSDLFLVGQTSFILCAERLAAALRRARIRNVRLVRLTEWTVAPSTVAFWREAADEAGRRRRGAANGQAPSAYGG